MQLTFFNHECVVEGNTVNTDMARCLDSCQGTSTLTHPCLCTVISNLNTAEDRFDPGEGLRPCLANHWIRPTVLSHLPGILILTTSPSLCASARVHIYMYVYTCLWVCIQLCRVLASLTSVNTSADHVGLFQQHVDCGPGFTFTVVSAAPSCLPVKC